MAKTTLNAEAVKASAANLGRLMDDMSAFTALQNTTPGLGSLDLAHQLRSIVDDRQTGIVVHAKELKTALDKIEKALTTIATGVQDIDDGTADRITSIVTDLRVQVHDPAADRPTD